MTREPTRDLTGANCKSKRDRGERHSLVPLRGSGEVLIVSQYTAPNLIIEGSKGTRYAYRRFGNTDSTPVVFLQHFRGNLDNWDPALIDDIAAQREVILVDNVGWVFRRGARPIQSMDWPATFWISSMGWV